MEEVKRMNFCRCNCSAVSVIAAVFLGVVTAFLQITGVITVTTAFLWVLFGIAVGYLAVLLVADRFRGDDGCQCRCTLLDGVLTGALGTILFSVVLLAVGIVATSVISAILSGLLLFFFTLLIASTAQYIRCLADCNE